MVKHTPELITELPENCIFVFGSNTAGIHGSGAALLARKHFGAQLGIGEGLTGQCYAFPTLNGDSRGGLILEKRTDEEIWWSALRFYNTVRMHPEKIFLLTKVGCGLAGYDEDFMSGFFYEMNQPNLIKPEGW